MHVSEMNLFAAEIAVLAEAAGRPCRPETVQLYWRVLKDLSLQQLREHVNAAILRMEETSGGKVEMPRPWELRTKDGLVRRGPSAEDDPRLQSAIALSVRNWNERLAIDPQLYRIELAIARAGRALAAHEPASPIFEAALTEDRCARAERAALLRRRREQPAPLHLPADEEQVA